MLYWTDMLDFEIENDTHSELDRLFDSLAERKRVAHFQHILHVQSKMTAESLR